MVREIELSELIDKIQAAISEKFAEEKFWVIADITDHSPCWRERLARAK